jgi:hypothetical protein
METFRLPCFLWQQVSPNDEKAMENLGRYIIRASFPQERLQYLDQEGMPPKGSAPGEPDLRRSFVLRIREGGMTWVLNRRMPFRWR